MTSSNSFQYSADHSSFPFIFQAVFFRFPDQIAVPLAAAHESVNVYITFWFFLRDCPAARTAAIRSACCADSDFPASPRVVHPRGSMPPPSIVYRELLGSEPPVDQAGPRPRVMSGFAPPSPVAQVQPLPLSSSPGSWSQRGCTFSRPRV